MKYSLLFAAALAIAGSMSRAEGAWSGDSNESSDPAVTSAGDLDSEWVPDDGGSADNNGGDDTGVDHNGGEGGGDGHHGGDGGDGHQGGDGGGEGHQGGDGGGEGHDGDGHDGGDDRGSDD